jgi:adenosylcobinamide-GDP ribazoletransferase
MTHELRLFFIALQFLTRVPVPRWVGWRDEWLHDSARHFAAVGLCVGAVCAAVHALASMLWPPAVAVGLAIAAGLLLTGAFHEDGFADVCDGLGGAVSRERALLIMKDSRIGAYGAIGIVVMLGLKAAALTSLPAAWVGAALLLAHCASRAASVSLIRWLPYAGDVEHAKAKPLAQRLSTAGLWVSWAWVLALAMALVAWRPASALAVAGALLLALLCAAWCARWFRQRLGGYTGDCLGATQQLCELVIYLGLLALLRHV